MQVPVICIAVLSLIVSLASFWLHYSSLSERARRYRELTEPVKFNQIRTSHLDRTLSALIRKLGLEVDSSGTKATVIKQ